jgi:hypothetical protein
VPAQHGPDGSEHLVGEVTGLVLGGEDLPTVYVRTSQAAAEAAKLLGARAVVPLHFKGWAHFTQGRDSLSAAFDIVGACRAGGRSPPCRCWP